MTMLPIAYSAGTPQDSEGPASLRPLYTRLPLGSRYYATDTGELDVVSPTGWVNITGAPNGTYDAAGAAAAAQAAAIAAGLHGISYADNSSLPGAVSGATAGGAVIANPTVVYDVNSPMRPSAARVQIDGLGASLRVGPAPTGDTAIADILIEDNGQTDCTVRRFYFAVRNGGTIPGGTTRLLQIGGTRWAIRECIFASGDSEGVRFSTGATDCSVVDNFFNGSGLEIGWLGTTRCRAERNIILNAPADAIDCTGNGSGASDSRIVGNTILTSVGMGIQEQQSSVGCLIADNLVEGAGTMGISSVGQKAIIRGNVVRDPGGNNAIEVGAFGSLVSNNQARMSARALTNAVGVAIGPGSGGGGDIGVVGNYLNQTLVGIASESGVTVSGAVISGNTIDEPVTQGINWAPSAQAGASIVGNAITFLQAQVASTPSRYGIIVGQQSNTTTVSGNTVTYGSASGSATNDAFMVIQSSYVEVTGNIFNASGRTNPGTVGANVAVTSPTFTSNLFKGGATLDTTNMTTPVVANNTTVA